MEKQTDHHSTPVNKDNLSITGHSKLESLDDPVSRSVPTLRFPRPQGSQVLAHWVSTSSPDIMASPPSYEDDSPLSESTFEFIPRGNADDSSQDERADSASESLSEYERYPNPDEVQAFGPLDDMSNSAASTVATDSEREEDDDDGEEGDEEEGDTLEQHSIPSGEQVFSPFEMADPDEMLRSPLIQGSIAKPFSPTASLPAYSIEFNEPEDVDIHIDKISVKHTVKEFSEEDAAEFFTRVGLGEAPPRVSATIRQTMSQKCLSTHEAFRVLYIGDEALKGEIILKISRAITCSSSLDHNENKALRRNTEGVYNIVPVTFGAIKDRDVELMEATDFQIKVDTCLDAEKIPIDSRYFRNDIIYSLTVDGENGGKKYKSVPAGGPEGARVQPSWTLPHVATFYCSEDDDDELLRVQKTAWEFCRRHAIPTLFISDHPAFASPIASRWINYTNEHAVCLSLESRGWWTEHRFPIDLTSFLNIDNRQMNQNLAYLTGLQGPVPVTDEKSRDIVSLAGDLHQRWLDLWKGDLGDTRHNVAMLAQASLHLMAAMLRPLQFSRLITLAIVFMAILSLASRIMQGPLSAPSAVSNLDGLAVTPSVSTAAIATTTATVTVSHVSTKTIRVVPTSTDPFLIPSDTDNEATSGAYRPLAVELNSEDEILVKFNGPKGTRLAIAGFSVQVSRDETVIPHVLLNMPSSTVVDIPGKEKYGLVNVTVMPTRKPELNETFPIIFGMSRWNGIVEKIQEAFQSVMQTVGDSAEGAMESVGNNYAPALSPAEGLVRKKADSWFGSIRNASKALGSKYSALKESESNTADDADDLWFKPLRLARERVHEAREAAHYYLLDNTRETYATLRDSIRPAVATTVVTAVKDAQQVMVNQLRQVEDFREGGKLAVLKAQIASRLWWLRVQGKTEEAEVYERQARGFMAQKHAEAVEAKKLRELEAVTTRCLRTGSSMCQCNDKGMRRWKV